MDKFVIIFLVLFIILLFILGSSDSNPSQNDIQTLEYVKNLDTIDSNYKDFPYPQMSNGFRKLTKGVVTPLNNIKDILPNNSSRIDVIRNKDDPNSTKNYYLPDFYRKDRLCGNDIGTEELRPFIIDDNKSDDSWTDGNVSNHPKFYTNDINNELTNIGSFFDKNNMYHDKTSSNTDVLASDSCYKDKMGNLICENTSRLQNIPPALITDPQKCQTFNIIGNYTDKIASLGTEFNIEKNNGSSLGVWTYNDDRTINGKKFYGDVYPSKKYNENYSAPILKLSCDECPDI
tara:strand:+ start:2465 stop:3331 length:867 start_codon:yes stop_codon:yes gene_type:complete